MLLWFCVGFHSVLAMIAPTLPIVIVYFKIRSATMASESN